MPQMISKYFSLEEMCRSDLADRNGIDNLARDPAVIAALTELATRLLDPIREHYGRSIRPNSGYRSRKLEEKLYFKKVAELKRSGGAAAVDAWFNAKQHPKGEAADLEIPGVPNAKFYEWIKGSGLEFDQLILEGVTRPDDPTSGWVHVSYRRGRNRRKAFLMADTGL